MSYHILVQAKVEGDCEARVPFSIETRHSRHLIRVDEACFARSSDHKECTLEFDQDDQSRRVTRHKLRYSLPQTVWVEMESCKGQVDFFAQLARMGRGESEHRRFRVAGVNGLESFEAKHDDGSVDLLYVSMFAYSGAKFRVKLYKEFPSRLRPGTSLKVTVKDTNTAQLDWSPGRSWDAHKVKIDELAYDLYWWKADSPQVSHGDILSTACGLEALPGVMMAKDLHSLSYTVKNLEAGAIYYFNVVAKCTPSACPQKMLNSVAYRPKFQVMLQGNGWMVVGFVVLSALALSLLIPAVVYARRMYKEKQVLKRQLEYEMCDVRNVIALDTERSATSTVNEESNLLGSDTGYQLNQI